MQLQLDGLQEQAATQSIGRLGQHATATPERPSHEVRGKAHSSKRIFITALSLPMPVPATLWQDCPCSNLQPTKAKARNCTRSSLKKRNTCLKLKELLFTPLRSDAVWEDLSGVLEIA